MAEMLPSASRSSSVLSSRSRVSATGTSRNSICSVSVSGKYPDSHRVNPPGLNVLTNGRITGPFYPLVPDHSSVGARPDRLKVSRRLHVVTASVSRRPSLPRGAIDDLPVLLQVLFHVCQIRLALLEKGLRIPERQPQQPPHLVARQRTGSVASLAIASRAPRDKSRHSPWRCLAMSSGSSTSMCIRAARRILRAPRDRLRAG